MNGIHLMKTRSSMWLKVSMLRLHCNATVGYSEEVTYILGIQMVRESFAFAKDRTMAPFEAWENCQSWPVAYLPLQLAHHTRCQQVIVHGTPEIIRWLDETITEVQIVKSYKPRDNNIYILLLRWVHGAYGWLALIRIIIIIIIIINILLLLLLFYY